MSMCRQALNVGRIEYIGLFRPGRDEINVLIFQLPIFDPYGIFGELDFRVAPGFSVKLLLLLFTVLLQISTTYSITRRPILYKNGPGNLP